ncbi:MAG: bifunctional phosphoribosylaminoimidazolecarboxamide formyltransferase/IMP cyclohydrolase [Chloroflexi bacterium]|nr:bifunctional phosphoribosylaminoimidazolecarboxamide formyltransferase/IMP cyclohydrolase [Chloroflexota bacterium]
MSKRVVVGVSGAGSSLRALVAAARRGALGADVALVFADRECRGLDWAAEEGIDTALVPIGADRAAADEVLAQTLLASGPDLVVLAGYMRILGPKTLAALPGRIVNLHPSLLPSFPGAHAVRDALAAGVRVSGTTVHLVDETLDGGTILAQQAVPVLPGDDEAALHERIKSVEHVLLPRVVASFLAGPDGQRAAARRALLSVSDKTGLVPLALALDGLGFELVSTGGTARALREAGLAVTDVAAMTGSPEMLDGRVKTLHPRIHAGLLADLRRADHRAQLADAAIDPFELVVVNLYPFEAAAARPDIALDDLIEEIDIGGPTLVRAAAKNHASVGLVTRSDQYEAVLGELRDPGGLTDGTRARLAVDAFEMIARYDEAIAAELAERLAGRSTRVLRLERVQPLRYGENPHQAAALYRIPGVDPASGPFAAGVRQLQGKPLSYNNLLDAAAAAGIARDLRGPACVIVKHTNPCGAAECATMAEAWDAALAGDPVSAFGGVVAVTRPIDAGLAERLASLFLEVIVAPAVDPDGAAILARRENLRVLLDPALGSPPISATEYRSAGGGLLATDADVTPDDPAGWSVATRRAPTDAERRDLDFAWRVARHVKSNAIVLARDGAIVGVGAGQMSRVDSARLAVEKAGERAIGAACASDAFFPFPDGVETCLAGGVTAFVQPGGSVRDAAVIEAADASGAAMLLTGVRHFRH